ncbi:MAG TPA: hypothetical protein VGX27_12025 [Candidatus Dormibacteraeota bacterium]|nr:hypothetical protein [Candidatus Dormibacteraeota bacterium]
MDRLILAALDLRLPRGRVHFSPARLLRPIVPNAHAQCRAGDQTIRHEALAWLLILGDRHLRLVLRQYVAHYKRQRPHLALDLRPSQAPAIAPDQSWSETPQAGLINEHWRAA